MDKKLTTLADLFRPPIDLMHKGSFETVRAHLWVQLGWLGRVSGWSHGWTIRRSGRDKYLMDRIWMGMLVTC